MPSLQRYVHRQRFSVDYEFDVHFTREVFAPANPLLAETFDSKKEGRRHRVFACVDSGLLEARPGLPGEIEAYFRDHSGACELVAPLFIVPGGEQCKADDSVARKIVDALTERRMDRQSFVLAVGGGAVLDVAGLAAAVVHRGLRLVRVPTTVLAQDDAGVGVKNGVNHRGVKNFLGTFAPPFAVINDASFLRTLPDVHWRGGTAEALKVAIIKDAGFFEFLEAKAGAIRGRDEDAMEELVRRCAVRHLEHIAGSGDPFETGAARPLDFGHWSAHKLEALSRHAVSHGDAVAIGILLDSHYAMRKGLLSSSEWEQIQAAVRAYGFDPWHPALDSRTPSGDLAVLEGLREFQEHLGGRLTITLPGPIGRKREVHEMDLPVVLEGLALLKKIGV